MLTQIHCCHIKRTDQLSHTKELKELHSFAFTNNYSIVGVILEGLAGLVPAKCSYGITMTCFSMTWLINQFIHFHDGGDEHWNVSFCALWTTSACSFGQLY